MATFCSVLPNCRSRAEATHTRTELIEARPIGVDKGTAVAALARQKPFAGRTILFGGDDTTDLDVFRILPRLGGRGFSVGKHFAGAEHVFESPRAVRAWLSRTAEAGAS